MSVPNTNLYERFHSSTQKQSKVINKRNFTYRIILTIINRHVRKGDTLDIGCGAGTIDFYLAQNGFSVTGVDISKSAISAARATAKELHIDSVSFEQLDFPMNIPRDTYDNILCMEVIEHLKDDKLALKRIFELLKVGGTAVISTPSQNAPLFRLGLAKEFDKRVGHIRRYNLEQLTNMCENEGFKIIKTYKTEGILRNFLFVNPYGGRFVRYIKFFVVDIVSIIDELFVKLFGESDLFVILKKP